MLQRQLVFVSFVFIVTCARNHSPNREVKVAMHHTEKKRIQQGNLHAIEFCSQRDCDPTMEGTRLLALGAAHGPQEYRVEGLLVYSVPNNGARILNRDQLLGRIALVDRGVVPLVDKVIFDLCEP
jgi:hypothetical protein